MPLDGRLKKRGRAVEACVGEICLIELQEMITEVVLGRVTIGLLYGACFSLCLSLCLS